MRYLLVLAILLPSFASAEKFRFRIRENYDVHKIDIDGTTHTYQGFGNTLNFWYEKPFEYSIGLAFSPILGKARAKDTAAPELGGSVKAFLLGVEGKYFLLSQLFTRGGVYWSKLDTNGTLDDLTGFGFYAGTGWEFKVGKVGIAPEFGVRQAFYQDDVKVFSIVPSVGVHFYEMF